MHPMAKQLTDLDIGETSGVDHPAHLTEGWLLMKSKDGLAAKVAELLKASTTECPECSESVPNGDGYCPGCGHKMPAMQKSADPDRLKQLHSVIGELISEGGGMGEQNQTVTKAEGEETPKSEPTEDEVLKALPETVRELITKERERSDELAKRLDAEVERRETADAIEKARGWSNLGIEADDFGAALRKLRSIDAELAETFEKALDGAQTVAEASKVFDVVGKATGSAGGSKLDTMTKEYMAKNAGTDYADAQSAVLGTPEGQAAYEEVRVETMKGA